MRLEYKYFIPRKDLPRLRQAIKPYVRSDVFCEQQPNKEYTVRSIYYDTSKLDNYVEKIEGIKTRRKVRIRGYNQFAPGDRVFLEIKRKLGVRIYKNRAPLPYENLEEFLLRGEINALGENAFKDENRAADAQKFLYQIRRNRMHREVLVVYEREAFHGRFNDALRISFDKNLRGRIRPQINQLYSNDNLIHAFSQLYVLEIKFYHGIPLWLKDILRTFNLRQRAISKYTICRDVHKKENILGAPARFKHLQIER